MAKAAQPKRDPSQPKRDPSQPKKRPPLPKNRPGPFHSKYSPHALDILKWRRDGWTWNQVVVELGKRHCKADERGVCRFIKRFQGDKPYGIGQRPEPAACGSLPEAASRQTGDPTPDVDTKRTPKISYAEHKEQRDKEEQAASLILGCNLTEAGGK